MTGKTHILGGIALSTGTLSLLRFCGVPFDALSTGAFFFTSIIGSLLPDIDEPNSTISRKLPALSSAFAIERHRKKLRSYNPFVSNEEKKKRYQDARDASHRGWTHFISTWIICAAICSSACILLFSILGKNCKPLVFLIMGILPGALSHILLDMISGKVRLFPNKKSVGICLIKTNGLPEKVIVRPTLFLLIIVLLLSLF